MKTPQPFGPLHQRAGVVPNPHALYGPHPADIRAPTMPSLNLVDAVFKKNALYSYGVSFLKLTLGFAWMTILTRAAGIDIYGMLAILGALTGALSNLLTFRTNEAVVTFYKRGQITNSPALCRLALGAGLALDLAAASLIYGIAHLFAHTIAENLLHNPEATATVTLYSWIIVATFLRGTGIGLLTAKERFRTIYTLNVFEPLLRVAGLLLLLLYGHPLSLELIIWIMLLPSLAVTTALASLPLVRLIKIPRGLSLPKRELHNYVTFSLSTFASTTLKAGSRDIDTMILGFLTTPTTVGIYAIFRQFLTPLTLIIAPYYEQIYPKFVQAIHDGDSAAITHTIGRVNSTLSRWSALLLIAVSLFLVAYWWYSALPFALEYLLTFFFMAAAGMLGQRLWWTRGFSLSYDPNISLVGNLLSSVVTVSLVFTFTSMLGIVGTGIGLLATITVLTWYWRSALSRYVYGRTSHPANLELSK